MKYLILGILLAGLYSCKPEKPQKPEVPVKAGYQPVSISTRSMEFNAPDSISSGWHEFIYDNQSGDIHFFVLEKLPEGITLVDYKNDLISVFESALDLMDEGKVEEGFKEFEKIPEWFSQVVNIGGVGLIGPRSKASATFFLEPGRYAMECYVRMPNGRPHALMGMLDEIIVTSDSSSLTPPETDLTVEVSSSGGITFQDTVAEGSYTIRVNYIDQARYENMMGHDVNLVRIETGADPAALAAWINAADPTAFRTPAPEGFEFIGGIQELPSGNHGYFEAVLEEGNYVLISEVPDAINRNMIAPFTVIH